VLLEAALEVDRVVAKRGRKFLHGRALVRVAIRQRVADELGVGHGALDGVGAQNIHQKGKHELGHLKDRRRMHERGQRRVKGLHGGV